MTVGAAVVTGGASGFGRAVASELAASGSDVALLDIDGPRARDEASAIAAAHRVHAIGRAVDVASGDDLSAAAAAITEELGHCDLLWVNVGVQHFGSIETTPADVWRWVLDVNLVGAVRTVQSFLPLLRAAGTATIAFTASANVLAPAARLGAYQASKYGLVGLAETLRKELAADGIGVSIVYPSGMLTRHLESSAEARPATLGPGNVSDEDLEAMMASRPMSDADLTTAEEAARHAVAGVVAGAPYIVTHGELDAVVAEHHAAIQAALAASRRT